MFNLTIQLQTVQLSSNQMRESQERASAELCHSRQIDRLLFALRTINVFVPHWPEKRWWGRQEALVSDWSEIIGGDRAVKGGYKIEHDWCLSTVLVKMEYLVDVQGFKITVNEFVYKEMAIIRLEEDAQPSVYLFKPPYHWDQLLEQNKSENRWLERNFHGILWRAGDVPHNEVGRIIRTIVGDCRVYVKGLEKSNWLRRILADE